MFVFRKMRRALFYCNTRFEIHPFALIPTKCASTFQRYFLISKQVSFAFQNLHFI